MTNGLGGGGWRRGGGMGLGGGYGLGKTRDCRRGPQTGPVSPMRIPSVAPTETGAHWQALAGKAGHLVTAVVDEERCAGCGICVGVCLERALSMQEVVVVDTQRCTGCGACIAECQSEALSLRPQTFARGVAG